MRKRRAIRGYVRKLPRMLCVDYGFAQAYTPQQIRATIERNGLNLDHLAYAVAMFSDPAGFAQFHENTGDRYKWTAMRDEVAAYYMDANANFDVSHMMNAFGDAAGGGTEVGLHGGADGHGGGH
ncbi:MAG TPA: DUF6559 family protein [Acetobacteraceae bacterium]|nr:DUF6559 family protein [Acetobacteraceae bacterium]